MYRVTMRTKRSYDDGCGMAHALDLVGERWALLVVRELLLGPKRFTDLRAGLPGVSPNVLSQRLRELEDFGVVTRRKLAPPAGSWVYELSDWGQELEPVVKQLGRWGARSPLKPSDLPLGVDSLILSMRTMFDAEAARDLSATLNLRLGEDHFHARVADGTIDADRGLATDPDTVVEAPAQLLAGIIYGGLPADDAVKTGELRITGDRAVFDRFIQLFPLPALAHTQPP